MVPVRQLTSLDHYHAVILPGSKNTAQSLNFLRESGLAAQVSRAARAGILVLGVCGGLQLLGRQLRDPEGLEGGGESGGGGSKGDYPGLGLLDLVTTLQPHKTLLQREVYWEDSGTLLRGYEIHHGYTEAELGPGSGLGLVPLLPDNLGWRQGNVWGVYLHGLLENREFRREFLSRAGWQGQRDQPSEDYYWWEERVDRELDRIARVLAGTGWKI